MPMKREREEEDIPKKFRQTTLDFHFSSKDKRKKVEQREPEEEEEVEEMNQEMLSEEERAELRRKRELMAAAAERRKQANSPFSTPPQSPPSLDSQDNGSTTNPAAASSSKIDISTSSPSPSSSSTAHSTKSKSMAKKSKMLDALSRASEESKQPRTSCDENTMSKDTYQRVDWYDYVVEQSQKVGLGGREERNEGQSHRGASSGREIHHEGQSRDRVRLRGREKLSEGPSTSREGLEERLADAEGRLEELEDWDEDGAEAAEGQKKEVGMTRAQGGAASPTLEYSYEGDGSQPLFTDSEPLEEYSQANEDVSPPYWKGTPISELNRAPDCLEVLPELRPSKDHTVLFRPQVRSDIPPRPFPDNYQDKWDSDHVRMPCSPENLYPVEDQSGRKKVQSRWELIETTLLSGIKSSIDLEEAILTYNARYSQRWNFRALHTLFTEVLDSEETVYFFDKVLPEMVRLALQLPKLCTQAVPLLKRQRTHSITLSQQQIASLLANAFFCTFPRRNAQQKKSEYSSFPDINFNRLFELGKGAKNHRKIEKLKCILNYFRRVTASAPNGTVTITRRALHDTPRWDISTSTLARLHMASSGMIEREGHGMLQMDFANKYIGGGALGYGCVQEEIRFMVCPELIVTRLFTEVLEDNECIIIKGVEQFSNYSGYANTFKWTGTFIDHTPRDSWGRKESEIVAIDALVIRSHDSQFNPSLLHREINKAYCGFYGNQVSPKHLQAVATGNWGCGAFGGDTRLKGLLQLMAASENGRDMVYFTFGDKELCDDMTAMHEFLTAQGVTVGDLWVKIRRYWSDVMQRKAGAAKPRLFPYLYQLYTTCDSDTDEYDPEESRNPVQAESLSPDYRAGTP